MENVLYRNHNHHKKLALAPLSSKNHRKRHQDRSNSKERPKQSKERVTCAIKETWGAREPLDSQELIQLVLLCNLSKTPSALGSLEPPWEQDSLLTIYAIMGFNP